MSELKIAIQGVKGAFHQEALEHIYLQPYELVECDNFKDVAKKTTKKQVDLSIMAIENSIAGSILPNYSLIFKHKLNIISEVIIPIDQYLMCLKGQTIDDIKQVISHPMALMQCSKYFENKEHIKLIETSDTAGSAKWINENNEKNIAAIAPKQAAEIYGLEIIGEKIQTISNNFTRFVLLKSESERKYIPGFNKASWYIEIESEVGSLYRLLKVLKKYDVNLTKIQSISIPEQPWKYGFILNMETPKKQKKYDKCLEKFKKMCYKMYVLGEYKKYVP